MFNAAAKKGNVVQVVCIDGEGKARGMGLLSEPGLLIKTSLNLVRRILHPSNKLLELLGKDIKFELTCGVNGRIWIRSDNLKDVVTIANTLVDSEFMTDQGIKNLVEQNIKAMCGVS